MVLADECIVAQSSEQQEMRRPLLFGRAFRHERRRRNSLRDVPGRAPARAIIFARTRLVIFRVYARLINSPPLSLCRSASTRGGIRASLYALLARTAHGDETTVAPRFRQRKQKTRQRTVRALVHLARRRRKDRGELASASASAAATCTPNCVSVCVCAETHAVKERNGTGRCK